MEKDIYNMTEDEMKEYLAEYYKEKIDEFCKGKSLEEQVKFVRQCRDLYNNIQEYVEGLGGTTQFGKITPDGIEYSICPPYTPQWVDVTFRFEEEQEDV